MVKEDQTTNNSYSAEWSHPAACGRASVPDEVYTHHDIPASGEPAPLRQDHPTDGVNH